MRDESRSRIHRSRAADGDEQIALVQLLEDPVHAERHLSEPDHVRTQLASTPIAAWRNAVVSALVSKRRAIAGVAARLQELAVHVQDVARACPFVQRVDVLGTEEKAVPDFLLELRQ